MKQRGDLDAAIACAPVRPHDDQAERLRVYPKRLAEVVAFDRVWLVAAEAYIIHSLRIQHGGLNDRLCPQELRDLEQSL